MNLAEELNIKSSSKEELQKEIENEIVKYFKDIFESGRFEKQLRKIIYPENVINRSKNIWVEFWDYISGCSDTNFTIGPCRWKNPEGSGFDSRTYKNVKLWDIQKKVGPRLLNLTEYYLKEMGFKVSVTDDESWLKYYKKKITLTW